MNKYRALAGTYLNKVENNLSNVIKPANIILTDLNKFLNSNSKRIRSILSILYLLATDTDIPESVIKLISATELIHNSSLLHDDVIDNAALRRGETTFWKRHNEKVAVLCGDYLLSFAVRLLSELNNQQVFELYLNTTREMSLAEINQYILRNKKTDINDYLNIISGKTASLFKSMLEASAILTNTDSEKAKSFGEIFGILYQINNDMQTESITNDNANGTKTIKDILGIEKSISLKDNYKHKIREILTTIPDNKYKIGLEDLIKIL